MAWYDELYFNTANAKIQGWIGWNVSTNTAENKSTVTCNVQYARQSDGYTTKGTYTGTVTCNGVSKSISKHVTLNNGTWVVMGIVSFDVPHNADGTKTCTISVSGYIPNTTLSSSSGSKTTTLPTIPRYPAINSFSLNNRTPVSASFSWNADSTINQFQYRLNSGGWSTVNVNARSGSYTITGLSPDTSYSTTVRVQRADSGLWSSESATSFSTLNVPTITSNVNFNIGSNLNLTFSNPGGNTFSVRFYIGSTLIATSGNTSSTSYTWSFTTDQMNRLYQNCPGGKTLGVTFSTLTSLGGATFERSRSGTATVVESLNKPTQPAFTFANTHEKSNDVLGSTNIAIQGIGNIRATITTLSTPKNSSSIVSYVGGILQNDTTYRYAESASASSVYLDFPTPNSPGKYDIRIYSVDSRGFTSQITQQSFTVLSYHQPTILPSINRLNNYEKETLLHLTGFYSSLNVNRTAKNSMQRLQYRYAEIGQAMSTYQDLEPSASVSESDDIKVEVTKDLSSPFLILDINKSYNVEFIIEDKLQSNSYTAFVSQGIPICSMADNGQVGINCVPEVSKKSLQVKGGADITGDLIVDDVNVIPTLNQLNSSLKKENSSYIGDYYLKGTINFVKIGNIICVDSDSETKVAISNNTWTTIGYIPPGYYSDKNIYIPLLTYGMHNGLICLNINGNIEMLVTESIGAGTFLRFRCCYIR